jgi:hypothetical protein
MKKLAAACEAQSDFSKARLRKASATPEAMKAANVIGPYSVRKRRPH